VVYNARRGWYGERGS